VDQMDEVLALALEGPLPAALPAEADVLSAAQTTESSATQPAPQ